jgi:hypothetical protein
MSIDQLLVVAGVLIATSALVVSAWQTVLTTRIARATFWLELRKMFEEYDDVHVKLRPNGAWHKKNDVPSPDDLPRVEAYMGLFEHCDRMIDQHLIDLPTFKSLYEYRIDNILDNKVIVFEKLLARGEDWEDFIHLVNRLGKEIPINIA